MVLSTALMYAKLC